MKKRKSLFLILFGAYMNLGCVLIKDLVREMEMEMEMEMEKEKVDNLMVPVGSSNFFFFLTKSGIQTQPLGISELSAALQANVAGGKTLQRRWPRVWLEI